MRKKKSILEYFPYPTYRKGQRELLETFEKCVSTFDVAVITAPVGAGKSAIIQTIARYLNDSSVIFPTNTLLNQFLDEFPTFPKLHKKEWYTCPLFETEGFKCSYVSSKYRNKVKCIDCEYKKDKKTAFIKYIGAYNYYTYMAMKLYHSHLMVDEAQQLLGMLQDLASKKFWQKDIQYPNWVYNYDDILDWITGLSNPSEKHIELLNTITAEKKLSILERGVELLRGEKEDVMKLIPISVAEHPPVLWPPHRAKKIVLVSATLNQVDIQDLGLDTEKRVVYLDADSGIPIQNKPLICSYVGNINYHNTSSMIPKLAEKIIEIANSKDTRGLIHTTYSMSKKLASYLPKDRFLFHTSDDASFKFKDWKSGKLPHQAFIACGFEEGIDLAGDEFTWQIITKIQYLSLADPAVKYRAYETGEHGQRWYIWNSLRKVMQAYGRICRGPEDYGETWILDGNFDTLIDRALEFKLVPKWFYEVLFPDVTEITETNEKEIDIYDTIKF